MLAAAKLANTSIISKSANDQSTHVHDYMHAHEIVHALVCIYVSRAVFLHICIWTEVYIYMHFCRHCMYFDVHTHTHIHTCSLLHTNSSHLRFVFRAMLRAKSGDGCSPLQRATHRPFGALPDPEGGLGVRVGRARTRGPPRAMRPPRKPTQGFRFDAVLPRSASRRRHLI